MARILFIDDDPLTLETLKRSAEIFGHEAVLASSGEQAQTLLGDQPPDLILTDMMLPDIDGLTLVKDFKRNPAAADIPVVMLSASPEIDASQVAMEAGAEESDILADDLQITAQDHSEHVFIKGIIASLSDLRFHHPVRLQQHSYHTSANPFSNTVCSNCDSHDSRRTGYRVSSK
jgi:CheY-like chemotaxis protein